jgi:quercetin 2,3-dioxygenase
MIEKRSFNDLGHFKNDWLDTHYHFSFADWYDPARMGWGALRVWNDDTIGPKSGFPPHGHADMEIITYVRSGAITHQDSLGNQGKTEAGDVQVMSAGSGIRHAEYNLEDEPTTLYQIWIMPDGRGGQPSWGAKPFPRDLRTGRFQVLASGDPADEGALPIRADARVLGASAAAGSSLAYEAQAGRHLYLGVAKGAVEVNGVTLSAGDGAAIRDVEALAFNALQDAELVLVDCA